MITLLRSAVFLVGIFVVVGCTGSQTTTSLVDNQTGVISEQSSFVVAVEADGAYIDKPHPESGRMARDAMVAALSPYAGDVTEIRSYIPQDTATMDAVEQGADYLVYLKLHHWEERATEWSGLPDRVRVEVRLIDGQSGEVVEARMIEAESKFATLGGDHPEDLLVVPFDTFSRDLFGLSPAADS
ncbi:MAG: DUF4823 domain-containing protein [Pseudomonadota bacterium]